MTPLFNSSDRLEALSDGVFAIVITLLVLGLRVPPAKSAGSPALLWQALLGHWPSYFAFLLSFGTILIAWIGHHLVLQEVKTVSRALVWTNGFYLLCIAVLPFTTALVAEHLLYPSGKVAATIYAVHNTINGVAFLSLTQLSRASSRPDDPLHFASVRTLIGLGICGAAIALAPYSPLGSLVLVAATWLWWSSPPSLLPSPRA